MVRVMESEAPYRSNGAFPRADRGRIRSRLGATAKSVVLGVRQRIGARVSSVDGPSRRTPRRFTVELPVELVESLTDAAGLSRKTVDQFVEDVLEREMSGWYSQFPLPTPPEDFQRALDAQPDAAAFFATVSRRNHHAILARIEDAKRPVTRAQRIEDAIAMLRRGHTPYRQ